MNRLIATAVATLSLAVIAPAAHADTLAAAPSAPSPKVLDAECYYNWLNFKICKVKWGGSTYYCVKSVGNVEHYGCSRE